MKQKTTLLLLLIILGGALFFISNHFLRGYLRSEITLAKEIKTPLDSIDQYKLASEAPFRYRPLFSTIIKATYDSIYDDGNVEGFFLTYTVWSLLFYVTAVCAFYWLLLTIGFNPLASFSGSVIFLLLPAMLLAFTLPVHTREDTLAYTFLFTGLIFLIQKRTLAFVLVSVAGILCRETLLILPLLYFFYSGDESLVRRVIIALVPLLFWISIRAIMGHDQYDVWLGLRWNLNNIEQVAGFLFITFGVCWIPFSMSVVKTPVGNISKGVIFFYRSALFALVIIITTTFIGGIYNEIRLLYLLSPWMIVLTLHFVSEHRDRIYRLIKMKTYWLFAFTCAIFCGIVLFVFLHYQERIIVPGKFAVPYHIWIIITVCYIFILLLFLPFTLLSSQKKSDQ